MKPSSARPVTELKPKELAYDTTASGLRDWKVKFQAYHTASNMRSVPIATQQAFLVNTIASQMLKRIENEDLVEWYYRYLTHRNIEFELQGVTCTRSNNMGFPQGGVASAKLWLVAFDKAIEIINSNGVYGIGFADDCCALVGGTTWFTNFKKL